MRGSAFISSSNRCSYFTFKLRFLIKHMGRAGWREPKPSHRYSAEGLGCQGELAWCTEHFSSSPHFSLQICLLLLLHVFNLTYFPKMYVLFCRGSSFFLCSLPLTTKKAAHPDPCSLCAFLLVTTVEMIFRSSLISNNWAPNRSFTTVK